MSTFNSFRNSNAETFLNWFIRRSDHLDQIVFYFLSQKNATSARYFPIFDHNDKVRIVYLRGTRFPYTDMFILKLYHLLVYCSKKKASNYEYVHVFNVKKYTIKSNQVLHVDDPTYTQDEADEIKNLELKVNKAGFKLMIICTNTYTERWLKEITTLARIIIIEQGFEPLEFYTNIRKNKNFSCVYSSPYIHYGTDKHAKHSTWGASYLLDEIIPKLSRRDHDIEIHLIGEIGSHAQSVLKLFSNVYLYGRVNFKTNSEILARQWVGIYPRTYDHKRSMSKIFSYIGAGLPIVAFDLVDTEVVKINKLGILASNTDEFIEGVLRLKNNSTLLQTYQKRVIKSREKYSWSNLADKLNSVVYES